jgi:hypothetical protein
MVLTRRPTGSEPRDDDLWRLIETMRAKITEAGLAFEDTLYGRATQQQYYPSAADLQMAAGQRRGLMAGTVGQDG